MDVNNKIMTSDYSSSIKSLSDNTNTVTNNNIDNSISNNANTSLKSVSKKENVTSEKTNVTEKQIEKLASELNEKLKPVNKEFSYKIHEATNRVIIKIKDSNDGEVIKEVPSEESLDLYAKMLDMAGLIVDEKR